MQKSVYIFLLINIFTLANLLAICPVTATDIFQLSVSQVETKGLKIKVLPETILDTELSLEGDLFSGFLDEQACKIIRVPERTRIIGEVVELKRPSNFKRGAKIKVHVDRLMLYDGTTVKVSADFSSKPSMQDDDNPNALKSFGRKVLRETSNVSASTLVGAMDSVQYGGIGTAIATSGISTLVGAGLGLGMGLVGAVKNKGENLVSTGFEAINLKLESDFVFLEDLPIMEQPLQVMSTELLGVKINVNRISKLHSTSYGDYLVLDIDLVNQGPRELFMGDFVLSSRRHILPVYNNPLLASGGMQEPEQDKLSDGVKIAFSLGSIKKKDNYQLMLLDPVSQEIIANTEIDISTYL